MATSSATKALLLAPPIAALLLLAGCPDDAVSPSSDAGADSFHFQGSDASTCEAGYLGDPNQPARMELRQLLADGGDVPMKDGDDLDILFPPQGGRVAFVGVRATNVDGCGMQVTGVLRDPISKELRLDGRTVNLVREADGWGTTGQGTTDIVGGGEIGNYSNIPLCPNQWASQDVFDQTFELEVLITDHEKKTLDQTIHVTPRCAEPGAKQSACRCLCAKGYVLGQACGEDAGADASP